MISVFFNEEGYYITGDGIDIARCCSPALTIRGDRIFQPIHHTYKILYLALCELRDRAITGDVMVYNESRIIDEINGLVSPLDDVCEDWLNGIRRNVIPNIVGLVFFRKKQTKDTVAAAHNRLFSKIDESIRHKLAANETNKITAEKNTRRKRTINRLKQAWFGDNYGIR